MVTYRPCVNDRFSEKKRKALTESNGNPHAHFIIYQFCWVYNFHVLPLDIATFGARGALPQFNSRFQILSINEPGLSIIIISDQSRDTMGGNVIRFT